MYLYQNNFTVDKKNFTFYEKNNHFQMKKIALMREALLVIVRISKAFMLKRKLSLFVGKAFMASRKANSFNRSALLFISKAFSLKENHLFYKYNYHFDKKNQAFS